MASFIKRYVKVYKDGETISIPVYNSTSDTYFNGTSSHYIKIYKNGQTFNLPLQTNGNGPIKTSINGTTYTSSSMTPKTMTETYSSSLVAGSGNFYFIASGGINGNYMRTHTNKITWSNIYYKDKWNISHQYGVGQAVTVSNAENKQVACSYQCALMQSATIQFSFTRSTQDYSYVTYTHSGWWGTVTNWTGNSTTKNITTTGNALSTGNITCKWSTNITEGN